MQVRFGQSRPLSLSRKRCDVIGMASASTRATRSLFLALLLMCVSFGMLLLIAFEKWLRGQPFLWWLLLVFAISTLSMTVLKRIN